MPKVMPAYSAWPYLVASVGSALGLTVLLKQYGMGGSVIVFALGIMIGLSAIMVRPRGPAAPRSCGLRA